MEGAEQGDRQPGGAGGGRQCQGSSAGVEHRLGRQGLRLRRVGARAVRRSAIRACRARVEPRPISLVDVPTTACAVAGTSAPGPDGVSLVPAAHQRHICPRRLLLAPPARSPGKGSGRPRTVRRAHRRLPGALRPGATPSSSRTPRDCLPRCSAAAAWPPPTAAASAVMASTPSVSRLPTIRRSRRNGAEPGPA